MRTITRVLATAAASTALVVSGATVATAAPGAETAVTTIKLKPTATYYKTSNMVRGKVAVTGASDFYRLTATLNINNKAVAHNVPIYAYTDGTQGFYYNRRWGAGTLKLNNFKVSGPGYTDVRIGSVSNGVRIRYAIESSSGLRVTKKGKKLTFKVTATYRDNREKRRSPGRATIQVKKSGKWKTLKTVKLNSKGKATYKKSDGKKRQYRMKISTTTKIKGGTTRGAIKI
jgi:hypothetical protein